MNEKWMTELLQRLDRIADALEGLATPRAVAGGRAAEGPPAEPPGVPPERAVSAGPEQENGGAAPGPVTLVPEPLARFLECTAPDFLDSFLIIIMQQPQGQAASDEPAAGIET